MTESLPNDVPQLRDLISRLGTENEHLRAKLDAVLALCDEVDQRLNVIRHNGIPLWKTDSGTRGGVLTGHIRMAVGGDELAGLTECAAILGVSKQRVHQLDKARLMPPPVQRLRGGPIWLRSEVERYATARETKAGRPHYLNLCDPDLIYTTEQQAELEALARPCGAGDLAW